MEVKAIYKYARISPLKMRDVARAVQGLPVSNALDMLQFTPKKAAFLIGKTLKSAVANAENNHDLSADDLYVKSATINEGPAFKRWKPRARGGAAPIKKRTAHIEIILSDEGLQLKVEDEPRPAAKKKTAKKKTAKAEAKPAEAEEEIKDEEVTEEPVEETPAAAEQEAPAAEEEQAAEPEASAEEDTEEKKD